MDAANPTPERNKMFSSSHFLLKHCICLAHDSITRWISDRAVVRFLIASTLTLVITSISINGVGGLTSAHAQGAVSVDVSDSLYGTSSSAIRDLLRSSRRQTAKGELEAAGITLERALAIQPDNPVLWNALARLRYRQGGYREVQSLALRSESLAANNRSLILRNRQLGLAAEQALTGVVTPIADLDLQTPDDSLLARSSATAGSQSASTQIPAQVPAPIPAQGQSRTLNYESLPAPVSSDAYAVQQPRVTGPAVSAPPSPVYGNSQPSTATAPTQSDHQRVVIAPAPRVITKPQWNNQNVVVRPAPIPQSNQSPRPSTNHQVVTPTPQPGTAPTRSAPAVVSSNGIEERSFSHYGRGGRGVPRQYLPPPGMCRLWFDGRAASEQPAPAQCAALRRNVPAGSRLIVGEHRYSWEPFSKRY